MNLPLRIHSSVFVTPVYRLLWTIVATALAACATLSLSATTIIQPSFDGLVQQADYIVQAKVKSVTAEWRVDGPNKHIITKVELDVNEVIEGTPPHPLVLVMLGGKIGDQELRVDGSPQFKVGDEDILFVRGNGVQFTPFVAMEYGRYRIRHDAAAGRDHVARDNDAPLYDAKEVALPMETAGAGVSMKRDVQPLTPDDFKKQIHLSRKNNSSLKP